MGIFNRRRAAAEIARRVAEEVEREVAREQSHNEEMLRGAELLRDVARRMQAANAAAQARAAAAAQDGSSVQAAAPDETSAPEDLGQDAVAPDVTDGASQAGALDGLDAGDADAADGFAAAGGAGSSSAVAGRGRPTLSAEDTIPEFPAELAEVLARNAAKMQAQAAGGSVGSDEVDPSHMGESSPAVSSPEVTVMPEPTQPDQDAPAVPGEEPPAPQPIVPVASVQTDEQGEVTAVPAPPPRKSMPMPVEGRLTSSVVRVPPQVRDCSGIMVNGRRLKSFAYSTDVAVIHNTNADAILAVYPFTGHPQIMKAIQSVAKAPVFTGVGGGTTTGHRVLELAMFAEMQGMMGVVLNAPSPVETVERVVATVDIPVVVTVLEWDDFARAKVEAGARIVNVAAGRRTAEVVRAAREEYPDLPIIATGGNSPESIRATIEAGANALSWTPPSAPELQGMMMDQYRDGYASGEAIGHAPADGHGPHPIDALASQHLGVWLSDEE